MWELAGTCGNSPELAPISEESEDNLGTRRNSRELAGTCGNSPELSLVSEVFPPVSEESEDN